MLDEKNLNPFINVVATIDNALTEEECNDILQWKNNSNYVKDPGKIAEQYDGKKTQSYRVCDLYLDKRASGLISEDSILNKIISIVINFNNNNYKFDIQGVLSPEWPTLMEYNVGGHYDWHIDLFYSKATPLPAFRKLAMTVLLNQPKTEYEGGELSFLDIEEYTIEANKGDIILFPAFIPHKVTPVTKGQRNVLVGWFHGPSFK